MQIELTKLMDRTFQHCRHGLADTPDWLRVLAAVLATPTPSTTKHVALPHHASLSLPKRALNDLRVPWIVTLRSRPFPMAARPFITLATVGTADLQRLWFGNQIQAVRALGYALHNLPGFLSIPSSFDPSAYEHCVRIVSRYWNDLSPNLHQQLCIIMDYTHDDMQRVVVQRNA